MSYIERIKHHLIESDYGGKPVKLTKAEEAILERLYFCDSAIRKYLTRSRVVPMLKKKFGICERQAYKDYAACQEIFCHTTQKNKDYYVDVVLGLIQDTRLKALEAGDLKTAATCEANMIKAVKEITVGEDAAKFENIQPVNVQIGNFPQQINVALPDGFEEKINGILKEKTGTELTIDTLKKLQSKPFKAHGKV